MVKPIKLRQVGGSVSATLPKEMVERLNLGAGDTLFAVESNDGILLTPFDEKFESAMQIYRKTASKYRNALRELAK